jgi:hypothetical protein
MSFKKLQWNGALTKTANHHQKSLKLKPIEVKRWVDVTNPPHERHHPALV